jgi:hypothetical protein
MLVQIEIEFEDKSTKIVNVPIHIPKIYKGVQSVKVKGFEMNR